MEPLSEVVIAPPLRGVHPKDEARAGGGEECEGTGKADDGEEERHWRSSETPMERPSTVVMRTSSNEVENVFMGVGVG